MRDVEDPELHLRREGGAPTICRATRRETSVRVWAMINYATDANWKLEDRLAKREYVQQYALMSVAAS